MASGPFPPFRPSQRHQGFQHRPKATSLSPLALLSLPRRLYRPPHADGKLSSWGILPHYKIRLEDVLDQKHLPPISLKDFEEWLLFVEHSAQALYFILWLREYTAQYNAWAQKCRERSNRFFRNVDITILSPKRDRTPSASNSPDKPLLSRTDLNTAPDRRPPAKCTISQYRTPMPASLSPQLAAFFRRAQDTFFSPGPYELDLHPDILSPFQHRMDACSKDLLDGSARHPDPDIFADVARVVEAQLHESFDRFILAAYFNVGSSRTLCGFLGGSVFILIGAIVPIVVNFVHRQNRWERLAAMPGLWLGALVLIACYHGVCMMIWIFGDYRQLRTFEMFRPALSRPSENAKKATSAQRHRMASKTVEQPTVSPPAPITRPPKLHLASSHIANAQLDLAPVVLPATDNMKRGRGPRHALAPIMTDHMLPLKPPSPLEGRLGSPNLPEFVLNSLTPPRRARICSPPGSPPDPNSIPPLSPRPVGDPRSARSSLSSIGFYSTFSDDSSSSDAINYNPELAEMEIEVSGPYYDQSPDAMVEGEKSGLPTGRSYSPIPIPITSGFDPSQDDELAGDIHSGLRPSVPSEAAALAHQWRTAGFIRPYDYTRCDDEAEYDFVRPTASGATQDVFDFDALPPQELVCRCAEEVDCCCVSSCGATRQDTLGCIDEKTEPPDSPRRFVSSPNMGDPEKGLGEVELLPSPCPNALKTFMARVLDVYRPGLLRPWAAENTDTLPTAYTSFPARSRRSSRPSTQQSQMSSSRHQRRRRPGTADARPGTASSRPMTGGSSRPRTTESRPRTAESLWTHRSHGTCPHYRVEPRDIERNHRQLFLAVPAFRAPLTAVLSPVIVRAQWEIVIRSAVAAVVVCIGIGAALVALPVPH